MLLRRRLHDKHVGYMVHDLALLAIAIRDIRHVEMMNDGLHFVT